jgi:N-acetylglucosamine kinase-like BadF-type ATPase
MPDFCPQACVSEPEMKEFVIGVDIGATKSHLALFDTEGTLIDFDRWGPLNHEGLPGSFAQFEDELSQFVSRCLSKNGIAIDRLAYSVFGIAGDDTKSQHATISEILRKLGFERFTLANDAFLGVPAGSPDMTGICAINGTGCTLAGINREGKMLQIGGVSYISADYGGGGIMGRRAVSAVYSELFRKGEPTSMTGVLLKKLRISSKYDFVDKMYEKIADGSLSVNNFCSRLLFEAAAENDMVASKILRDVGISYAGGISCMIDDLSFRKEDELNIVFAGSVFVKGEHPLIVDTIKETVGKDSAGFNIKYTLLDLPPVAGAVIWALSMLKPEGFFREKVRSEFCDEKNQSKIIPR